ncbi:unnamed protein product [Phytophthora fragariaefolia]|uniref:Unnamed protein product n=1 Tax=Phytophthora fragariaefolia TaxID=1490495 RepID=A0A9W6UB76_9STRA|nr:unnamed protein product [Phytophthora fragariaefolia]
MQEEFSLRHAKLHVNVPLSMPRAAVKPSGGPEPMDLSSSTAAGPQQLRGSSNIRFSDAGSPAGDAFEHVDIGHAVLKTAAPSESHYHCKKEDDLKFNSKREVSSCIGGLWCVEQLCSTAEPSEV